MPVTGTPFVNVELPGRRFADREIIRRPAVGDDGGRDLTVRRVIRPCRLHRERALANATFCAPSVPPTPFPAHLSAFSSTVESVQPPAGFWSVIVSENSCPSTMVTPS